MHLLCKIGIHKYRANHVHLSDQDVGFVLPSGEIKTVVVETWILEDGNCIRCGKEPAPWMVVVS